MGVRHSRSLAAVLASVLAACAPSQPPLPPAASPAQGGEASFDPSTGLPSAGRSLTIPVAGAERVRLNDQVDLLTAFQVEGQWKARTAITGLRVLHVGPGQGTTRRLTFVLLPEEAEVVDLAVRLGGVHAAVRAAGDEPSPEDESGVATVHRLVDGELSRAFARIRSLRERALGPGEIGRGLRGFTVEVEGGDFAASGSRVDLIGQYQDPDGGMTALSLVEDVSVLSAGDLGADGRRALQLRVHPEEAEALLLATRFGPPRVSLRNPAFHGRQEERGRATVQTLLTGERLKALHEVRRSVIQVVRGCDSDPESERCGQRGTIKANPNKSFSDIPEGDIGSVRLERYPTLECPPKVPAGKPFALMVSLLTEKIDPAKVVQGQRGEDGKLAMDLPAADFWDLDVTVSAPGFLFKDGANAGRIRLEREGDSTPARFELTAEPASGPSAERTIFASFWLGSTFLGKAAAKVTVVASGAEAAEPVVVQGAVAQVEEAGGSPPDLHVEVVRRSDLPEQADLTVRSPFLQPGVPVRFDAPPGLSGWLRAQYDAFARARPRGVRRSEESEASDKQANVARLRGFGRQLWDSFAPPSFKQAFWKLRDSRGASFRTIHVYTNDPALPWELMRPWREKPDGTREELDFLGIEYQLARWHLGSGDGIRDLPPREARLDGVLAVAPDYSGAEDLPGQRDELLSLSSMPGFERVPANLQALAERLARAPDGVVHFAGHGEVAEDGGVPQYAMRLGEGKLDLMTWRGLEVTRQSHPLFFFNACDLGRADQVAGFVDGWAPAALERGASGYIGGLWPLGDAGAASFAARFYGMLGSQVRGGRPANVAAILSEVRRGFYETGDPTFLAYVYYGDPRFRFSR